MTIPSLKSIKPIERQYSTGEEPVLVLCSDMNSYICKYMRSSTSVYKLVCELTGSLMAKAWNSGTPNIAFVRIKPEHWAGVRTSINSLRKSGSIDSVQAVDYLSRYSNNLITVSPLQGIDIEPTEKNKEWLYRNYVYKGRLA